MASNDSNGPSQTFNELILRIQDLRNDALRLERQHMDKIQSVHPDFHASARNFLHYLAIRQHDIRPLQRRLHELGLSSLGRMEAYTLATLDSVLYILQQLAGKSKQSAAEKPAVSFRLGRQLLDEHTVDLLGPKPQQRVVRIMVTLGCEAANDYSLVRNLIKNGMNVMRINCAAGTPAEWKRMIDHLRRAEKEIGMSCRVLCDLPGPNPRTGQVAEPLVLSAGDRLILTQQVLPGSAAVRDAGGAIQSPAHIGCDLPEIFQDARLGEPVVFDDGKILGIIVEKSAEGLLIEIQKTRKDSAKLREFKNIHFPQTRLRLDFPTKKDLETLNFIIPHADMIGLSHIRTVKDIERIIQVLREHGGEHLGLVLKIETREAFENLPQLLLFAMRHPPVGVMVARGDMAVELSFSRMAEAQEEILWLCEAAHIPVIWATQVLESLAKKNLPSRGEVTDAAMSERAECVMLNKGKYIIETVQFLSDVMERMQDHQEKKQSMLRKLNISQIDKW